jgi:hypothetical protein
MTTSGTSEASRTSWTPYPPSPASKPEHTHHIIYDASKAQRIFGINYRSKEEVTKDLLEDFAVKGF